MLTLSYRTLFVIAVISILTLIYFKMPKDYSHSCDDPCTVHFDSPMAEDSYGTEYSGNGIIGGPGKVHVFRTYP